MIVQDMFRIRNRGPCVVVRGAPSDCLGKYLRQDGHLWKILGVEHPEINNCRGLLVQAIGGPEHPHEGEISLHDTAAE